MVAVVEWVAVMVVVARWLCPAVVEDVSGVTFVTN